MSIATEIERLQNAKASIKTAIENKGVEVGNGTLDTYAGKIDEISAGGGASKYKPRTISFKGYKGTDLDYEIQTLDTSNMTSMSDLFYGCSKLEHIDISHFDTRNVTDMSTMFSDCKKLTEIDLTFDGFDTSNVTTFSNMFSQCNMLSTIDLSKFNTSKAKYFASMFYYCYYLTQIDISNFDGSKATNTSYMFSQASRLETVIIDNPNVFPLTNINAFNGTPIASGTGYIYVPDDMVETYKTATNWSTYASQIKGISELPTED